MTFGERRGKEFHCYTLSTSEFGATRCWPELGHIRGSGCFCPVSLWDGTVSSHIRIRFLCYFVIYDFRLMICMVRMAFPCLVVFNFRLLSFWQDRLLSPCRVVGHSVVSYGSRALVTLCVCVCLFGWSSSVRVILCGRWCRLVGR